MTNFFFRCPTPPLLGYLESVQSLSGISASWGESWLTVLEDPEARGGLFSPTLGKIDIDEQLFDETDEPRVSSCSRIAGVTSTRRYGLLSLWFLFLGELRIILSRDG